MAGRKWLGALTLLAILICCRSYGSGPFVPSRALGVVMMKPPSSVMIDGAPAIYGTTVFQGDVIQTVAASTAVVKLRSGTSLTLSENSEVALESANPTAVGEKVNLRRGAVNLSNPNPQPVWVTVPGASVLVQGEGGFPAVCRIAAIGQSSAIINDRGHVEIRGSGAPLILPLGQSATLEAGRPQGGSQAAGTVTAAIPAENVTHANQTKAAPLNLQDAVYLKDVVQTINNGRVRITLKDGSLLNIGVRSTMTITNHDAQSQQTAIELEAGKLRSQVQKISSQGGKFEVTTQTAVIGVVGTDFIVEAHNDKDKKKRKTLVWCLEGSVRVRNIDPAIVGTILLGAGEFTTISSGLPPAAAVAASPSEVQTQISQTNPSGPTPNAAGVGNAGNVGSAGTAGSALTAGAVGAGVAGAATAGVAMGRDNSAANTLGQTESTLNGATGALNSASTNAANAVNAANNANQGASNAIGSLTGVLQQLNSPTYPCGCN